MLRIGLPSAVVEVTPCVPPQNAGNKAVALFRREQ